MMRTLPSQCSLCEERRGGGTSTQCLTLIQCGGLEGSIIIHSPSSSQHSVVSGTTKLDGGTYR